MSARPDRFLTLPPKQLAALRKVEEVRKTIAETREVLPVGLAQALTLLADAVGLLASNTDAATLEDA